jgi:hypothetical protein
VTPYDLELSLIVVNYHSHEPLECLLQSLARHPITVTHEVLVVNNSPDDGLDEWLARSYPDTRVLSSARNVGYARAVNRGIEAARGRDILVVNPDVVLEEGSVERALTYLRQNPEVGIVGVRLVNSDGSDQHNARRFYTLTTILLRRTPLGRLWPQHPAVRGHLMLDDDLSRARPVDWVTGAFMLVRREALDEVGGMDGRFFLYFEDVDWCQRMWDGGYEVHLLPEISLRHEHQRTSTRLNRSLIHHLRSFFSYYDKWGAMVYVARHLRGTWWRVAAVIADVLALNVAFLLAFFVRRLLDPFFPEALFDLVDYVPLILFTNVVSAVTLSLLGRYAAGPRLRGRRRTTDSLRAAFLVVLVVMAGTYLSHEQTFSRAVLLLFVPFYLGALEWTRRVQRRILEGRASTAGHFRRVGLIGELHPEDPERGEGWVLAGTLGSGGGGGRRLGDAAAASAVASAYRLDEILVGADVPAEESLLEELRRAEQQGTELYREDAWAVASKAGEVGPRDRLGRRWRRLRLLTS